MKKTTSVAWDLARVPTHEPCGEDGLGRVDNTSALVCAVRRAWRAGGRSFVDIAGCGKRFPLCVHGLRACAACIEHREAA